MIDPEVLRLRNLRGSALRARAMAAVLADCPEGGAPIFPRAALCCWQVARAVSGALRAHPYPPFQREPTSMQQLALSLSARSEGIVARHRGRGFQTLAAELRQVARRLADARALTRQQDLGDTLGRMQAQLGRLLAEASAAARNEAESQGRTVPALLVQPQTVGAVRGLEENWPYLAF